MDVHHIRYFLAVCETRNFTRAAEKCNVTQPALSRAIQQLEDEMGGLLFRRERNLTHLTDLGALLQPRLSTVLAGLVDARHEAARFLKLEDANLKVGVMCTIGPCRFTGLLADFHMRHSGIQLQLSEGVPRRLTEDLELGKIDVAIMTAREDFPDRFNLAPLYRERFFIAFPAGHRRLEQDDVTLEALSNENYLLRVDCEFQNYIGKLCTELGVKLKIAYASEREDWIQNMVAGGLGVCCIPEYSAVIPGLKMRPITGPEIWREICIVTVGGRRFSPVVSTFINTVKSYNWATAPAREHTH